MGARLTVRAVRYAAYAVGALVVLVVAAALAAPLFLDTPAVERELQAKLSQLVQGEVAWQKLSIRLLPTPRGSLTRVSAEIAGVASVRVEQADALLRLVPLLHGRTEIASIDLDKPVVRVRLAPSQAPEQTGPGPAGAGPVERYRSLVEAIRRFAPEASLDIEGGETDVDVAGLPPIRVRDLKVRARTDSKGLAMELSASSEAWKRLQLTASAGFQDFSGEAKAELADLRPQPWLDLVLARSPVKVALPSATLRVESRTDGRTKIESALDLRADSVELLRGGERVRVPAVSLDARAVAAGDDITVQLGRAELGAARLAAGSVRYELKSGSLASAADFDLDLAQALDATRRLLPADAGKAFERFQPVTGRAQGRAGFDMQRSRWTLRVDIRKSDSAIGIDGLPGPVKVAGGEVRVARDGVRIERADVSLLDARALASATVAYAGPLRIEGAASDGSVGADMLAWIWKAAGAPPAVALKTPIRFEVRRAAWSPGKPLDLSASAAFDAGPSVAVELGWTPSVLDIRRAAIRDASSDASFALHLEKGLAQGRFSGTLKSASIAAALAGAKLPSGAASGDLRFRVDLAHPERATATGSLQGDSLDLSWLLGRPLSVERVDLNADGQKLAIREAAVNWAEQRFALTGTLARAPDGAPIVDAELVSPGIVVDALLPRKEAKAPEPAAEKKNAQDDGLWKQWPLPVRGRIALRAGFIRYGERKAEPVAATLTLEEQKAFLELKEAQLCGISFPLTIAGTKEGLEIAVRLAAAKQQLEQTVRCLTERGVQITGEYDLSADLRTRGRPKDLLPNLEGTISAQSRNGRVMKFALLGNILSMTNVASLLKDGAPKFDETGFPYRGLTAKGRFASGRFIIDEGSFRSDAVGLAANGEISIIDYRSRLTVLVAPFERVDRIVRGVPLVGYLVGGLLTSIPVGVSGDIRDPLVVPLGPGAVTSELKGVFERTITLPGKLAPQQGGTSEREPSPVP